MTSFKKRRGRLGSLIAVALGALAIVALPGLASARDDSGDSTTTIKSFDQATGTLVLSLPEGETVTGLITRRTKIRCEDQRDRRGRHGREEIRGREAEPGDDHGGGREAEPGDDRGGHGEEAGDDGGGRGNEPGDDNGGDSPGRGSSGHDDNGSGANCSVADLVPGATVEEVDLDFDHGNVRFDEVELED